MARVINSLVPGVGDEVIGEELMSVAMPTDVVGSGVGGGGDEPLPVDDSHTAISPMATL